MTHKCSSIKKINRLLLRVFCIYTSRRSISSAIKGFTLVELLMVVAIIGILASVSIPSYNAYLNRAKNSRTKSEIRTIDTEIGAYALDHNNTIPSSLADISRGNYLDPWKNAYIYNNFEVNGSIDALMDPVNSLTLNNDYDLYSKGSDGLSAVLGNSPFNKDDVVRSNNGLFIGIR